MTTHALTRRVRAPRPPLLIGLQARVHGMSLDRELAAGVATWRSPCHAARAVQLTSPRYRASLADGLDRLLAEARRPARYHRLSAAVPPCRASVLGCASQIADLATAMRSAGPVSAEAVAGLRVLLCDGAGPVYNAGRGGELQRTLRRITLAVAVPT
jgi:hypothetical protein